jgi:hypothetical protein
MYQTRCTLLNTKSCLRSQHLNLFTLLLVTQPLFLLCEPCRSYITRNKRNTIAKIFSWRCLLTSLLQSFIIHVTDHICNCTNGTAVSLNNKNLATYSISVTISCLSLSRSDSKNAHSNWAENGQTWPIHNKDCFT